MAKRPLPTPEQLRQLLRYEPETGKLFWLHRKADTQPQRTWNARYAGKVAGCLRPDGYIHVSIMGRVVFAHRVAWVLHYGAWPEGVIDHSNGIRADNRILNLRQVSPSENCRNMAMNRQNSSGHSGVSWHKGDKKWRAYVQVDGKHIHLGNFESKDAAAEVAKSERDKRGFSQRHGLSR